MTEGRGSSWGPCEFMVGDDRPWVRVRVSVSVRVRVRVSVRVSVGVDPLAAPSVLWGRALRHRGCEHWQEREGLSSLVVGEPLLVVQAGSADEEGLEGGERRLLELVVVVPQARPVALHVEAARVEAAHSCLAHHAVSAARRGHAPRVHLLGRRVRVCWAWRAHGVDGRMREAKEMQQAEAAHAAPRGGDEAARTESTGAGG